MDYFYFGNKDKKKEQRMKKSLLLNKLLVISF